MNGSLSSLIHRAVSLFVLPQTRWQLLILAGLLVVAWMLALLVRRSIGRRLERLRIGRRFGVESLYRAIFWLCGAGLIWPVRNIARPFIPTALLDLALVPVVGIGLIYLSFFLLRRVFGRDKRTHRLLAVSEGITTIVVWIGVVLRGLGLDDDVLRWSASVQFAIGQARFTLLAVVQAVLSVSVMLILALWLAIAFEDRIMRSPKLDANLKVFSVRIGRGAFVLTAVVMSLSMVGIDLTVLGMFSGRSAWAWVSGCRRSPATMSPVSSCWRTGRCVLATLLAWAEFRAGSRRSAVVTRSCAASTASRR